MRCRADSPRLHSGAGRASASLQGALDTGYSKSAGRSTSSAHEVGALTGRSPSWWADASVALHAAALAGDLRCGPHALEVRSRALAVETGRADAGVALHATALAGDLRRGAHALEVRSGALAVETGRANAGVALHAAALAGDLWRGAHADEGGRCALAIEACRADAGVAL